MAKTYGVSMAEKTGDEVPLVNLTPQSGGADPKSEDIQGRFRELVKKWRKETKYYSSAGRMAIHPAYREIVGMGREAVPLLLAELRRKPDHWFLALHEITGADPVPPESEGRLQEMAQAWIRWGEAEGYIE